ncbi:MAG: hypothetical protein ACHQQQ_07095 [Bacteroidota bacterium]
MKKSICIGLLFFGLTIVARSQEEINVQLPDTSMNSSLNFKSESLFVKFSFSRLQSLEFLYQQPVMPSQPTFWTLPEKIDLISPWKLQLAHQDEYKTLYTILGSIQMGGVAYIAYQHVKKYGWK